MTWTVLLSMIGLSLIKILMTCLPTGVVERLLNLFQVHPKLDAANVSISVGSHSLGEEDIRKIIPHWNEAIFMQKHYIWPGTEQHYLYPDHKGIPLQIHTKMGKHDLKLHAFVDQDRIEVVKQWKTKLIAYTLSSEKLHQHLPASTGPAALHML